MPFRGGMGKTKDLSAFERGMVVGARCTGLSVSRNVFSRSTVSYVYQEWSSTQRTSCQLDTTVGSQHGPATMRSQHGPASLWNAFDTL